MAIPESVAPPRTGSGTQIDHRAAAVTVVALVESHWYDAAAILLDRSLQGGARDDVAVSSWFAQARQLAVAARRVLDLDAEDFAAIAREFTAPWTRRLASASFPLEPRERERGALGSLVPLYELMLEVIALRAVRGEPMQVVVTAHLIGEYLVQLAWESTLGHGGDPLQLGGFVGGSRWGTDDPACPHSSALRSTAKRALNACSGDVAGYTAYLDRFHSRQGDALGVCSLNHDTVPPGQRPDVGETCPNPCGFMTRQSRQDRRDLDARVRLARLYIGSPIVALRHHAPVGHFFGVPSVREVSEAWLQTWQKVSTPWPDGDNPLRAAPAVRRDATSEALPGMGQLVSAVAGRPIGAGRVIRNIGDDIGRALAAGAQPGVVA